MRIANYNINKNIKMEKDHPQICEDKQLNGVCSKGADCEICNSTNEKKKNLNPGAKEYIPKKKTKQQVPEKLNFNLEAKEFVQKQTRKKMKMMMKKTKSNLI